ncbi:hypothetical protein D3C86_1788680 [compost metagenome]
MAHVHGVQNPVTALVHVRHADDHRLGGHVQPALQVKGIVVDGRVITVGVISQVADVLISV